MNRPDWVDELTQRVWNVHISLEWRREHLKLFYKTVSIKPCINKEIKCRGSQFSYTVIVVTQTWSS